MGGILKRRRRVPTTAPSVTVNLWGAYAMLLLLAFANRVTGVALGDGCSGVREAMRTDPPQAKDRRTGREPAVPSVVRCGPVDSK